MNIFGIAIVAAAFMIVVVAYYLAIKNTIRPDEDEPDHIKRRILDDD